MIIKSLELKDFRNYEALSIGLDPGVNIFYGDNAQGKTNILESIYMCSTGKSHRGAKDREIIRFDRDESHIRMLAENKRSCRRIDMHLRKSGHKGIAVDGVPIRKITELFGICRFVLFSPEDLGIIKDSPAVRRRFMDMELCQLDPFYAKQLSAYNHVVMQRNSLLKDVYNRQDLLDTLDIWDVQLIKYAVPIIMRRRQFICALDKTVRKIHGRLTEGTEEAQLIYSENTKAEELNTEMVKNRDKEIRLGQTYVGPHRDDIAFMINGKEVKKYGSQGQQRSISLSLKLSEIEMVRELTGENPVLLLDDVLSELDRKRQEQLLSGISDIQTLITCTGVDEFVRDNFHIGHAWNVKSGTVTGGIYGQ